MGAPDRRDRRSARNEIAPRRPQPPLPDRRPPSVRRTSARYRPAGQRRVAPASRLPMALRLALIGALVVLGAVVYLGANGALGRGLAALGSTLGSAIVRALPAPSGSAGATFSSYAAPRLTAPTDPYTNRPTWDLAGRLPADVFGVRGLKIRVFVNGNAVDTVDAPSTIDFTVPGIPLVSGPNDLTASLLGPGGSGEPSDPIRVEFDNQPPTITLGSPKSGATIAAATVVVKGATQAGANVTISDDLTGATSAVVATDGSFQVTMALGEGTNTLTITATDPAGNVATASVQVKHTGGALTATLHLSHTVFSVKTLGALVVSATVTDASGHAVAGAQVVFSFSPPGAAGTAISDAIATDAGGTAGWTQPLPPGTPAGSGLVTVRVTTADGRVATSSQSFTVR